MWNKSLILGPALLVVFVVAYAANQGECYVHEGVGAILFFMGVPCFIISMVFFLRGMVTIVREGGADQAFDISLLLLIFVFAMAVYSVPFFEGALCPRW